MQQSEMGQRRENTPVMLCFGDSNTYGYDPRGFSGDRYPEESRWGDILSEKSGWMIKNAGQNGREIPRNPLQFQQAELLIAQTSPSLFTVMLGTNDLLQGATAQKATSRMERFLRHVQSGCSPILLIAPPPMQPGTWVTDQTLLGESRKLAEKYQSLARKLRIFFVDAGQWNVSLAFDGVHFTEAGHHAFAEGLWQYLMKELGAVAAGEKLSHPF